MGNSSTGKKGGKKIGRGLRSPAHARYVNENRWLSNKLKRLKKHCKRFEKDAVALRALKKVVG
jgi:ribosomal protein S15P/S13E